MVASRRDAKIILRVCADDALAPGAGDVQQQVAVRSLLTGATDDDDPVTRLIRARTGATQPDGEGGGDKNADQSRWRVAVVIPRFDELAVVDYSTCDGAS